jgi:hypothetical protein
MSDSQDRLAPDTGQLGVLARDFQARLVNCSPSGCLLETNARVEVGTIGTLRVNVDGREFADDVQVVRCQPIEGSSLFQVGAKFLLTAAAGDKGLRLMMGQGPLQDEESLVV